ncbi:FkbM family methyltransferase [Leptothoe spongobia]|uniref:FkbM family methyltransferase n=1 Tax=Leptothoe spongobia TAU-MAC 1115 TaxID=1967444 RepID=A0A947DDE3_9CYAN|nr:FkbM family methyltransferase [Leptothoe spongobia]MBT9314583.1 FkbM family methyltransferase [Leptothoe spongobia TAU-MAC 1115]
MKTLFRKALRRIGYDFISFSPRASSQARLQYFVKYLKVDLVLDVGANTGQYAQYLRELEYKGRIISFEPLSSAHKSLVKASTGDANWEVAPRFALANEDGELIINVSENSQSSSALNLEDIHIKHFPKSAYISTEKVLMRRLDNLVRESFLSNEKSIFLKIDVQGFEDKVLEGSKRILDIVSGIQVELSMVPLYENEMPYQDMIRYLGALGYELYALSPVVCEPESGKILQMDGLFVRT